MPETGKDERMRAKAKLFDMAKIFFLLIVIPLALMALLMFNGISTTEEPATRQEAALQPETGMVPEAGPDASRSAEEDAMVWNKVVVVILILSVIILLLIAALLSRGISRQYQVIAEERARHLDLMEREYQEKEWTLLQIVQGSTIPTFVINNDHVITHWNTALERLTGYRAEDMIGTNKHWQAFYTGEKPIMADLIVDNVSEDEIRKYYGVRGRRSPFIEGAYEAEDFYPQMGDGGRWVYFTAAPIRDPEGNIAGAIETCWDRTDSKLLNDEREKHLRYLSVLWNVTSSLSATLDPFERVRTAGVGIFENFADVDSLGVYLRRRNGTSRIVYSFGYREAFYQEGEGAGHDVIVDEVAEKNTIMFFEDITQDSTPCGEFLDEGLKSAAYLPLASKDSVFGVMRVSSHSSPRFSEEDSNLFPVIGNHVALAIENARLHYAAEKFGQDLERKVREKTRELKESYQELEKSEEKYRAMFDADPSPIIIVDRETFKILDVNATAVECYGYSRDEFVGMSFARLGHTIDQEVLEGLEKISSDQSEFYSRKLYRKKAGTSFYVNLHVSAVMFMGKDCLIVVTPDVSESVEKETQLIQASKMATLGTMASGIAHEISQPLNVIQVASDFLIKTVARNREIKKDDIISVASQIERNVQRAAQTIKHMKDFVRKSDVKGDRIDINNPIRDIFKILGQQLKVHGIGVELDLAEDIPLIFADHNRLEQVFMNLVTNARDALDESGQHGEKNEKMLKIRSFPEDGVVVVTVSDNGVGMSEQVKEKIFEPFFTTKKPGEGTGLGMSISYGIVTEYGGAITVESEAGKGTTFRLTFPVAS
ncbi:MAG: PAS domain S-box protein [Deltaproteobacteria bacterium]|nr:PAS domain S-box protein [Deltaproteobacteria bacterium]